MTSPSFTLTNDDVKRFQELYKNHFGKEVSQGDAYDQGIKLIQLMSIIYQPMTEEEFEQIQKRRQTTLPLLLNRILNV